MQFNEMGNMKGKTLMLFCMGEGIPGENYYRSGKGPWIRVALSRFYIL